MLRAASLRSAASAQAADYAVGRALLDAPIRWRAVVLIIVFIGAQATASAMGAVSLVALTLWSMRSVRTALQALSLGVLVIFVNPALAGDQPGVSALKWLLLGCAGIRIILGHVYIRNVPSWSVGLGIFSAAALLLAG